MIDKGSKLCRGYLHYYYFCYNILKNRPTVYMHICRLHNKALSRKCIKQTFCHCDGNFLPPHVISSNTFITTKVIFFQCLDQLQRTFLCSNGLSCTVFHPRDVRNRIAICPTCHIQNSVYVHFRCFVAISGFYYLWSHC